LRSTKKPIVEKIVFTEEQQADIDAIIAGRPVKAVVDSLIKRGWNTQQWQDKRIKQSKGSIQHQLKKEYYGGTCLRCAEWPDYKVLYDVDGGWLREFYCEKHLPKF
jgi:hypothetical protein